MRKYIYVGLLALAIASCSEDFLKEEMVSTITQDYFDTEQGLDQLVVGTYNAMRVKWGYREGPYMFETGHDCTLRSGSGSDYNTMSSYSTSVWSANGSIGTVANEFMGFQSKSNSGFLLNNYPIIDNCNKAINAIRSGNAKGEYATDADYAARRLSEVLFNRAYCYYELNTIFGDVYFSTTSSTSLPDNYVYKRTSAEEMYKTLIGDLRYAYEHLPASYSSGDYGRITKYAAAQLLARMYLHRAQGAEYGTSAYGRNADGSIDNTNEMSYLGMLYKGTGANDLDSCIYYATQVIENAPLATDYSDLFKSEIGSYPAEGNSEIVLPALFASGTDNYRYGLRVGYAFICNYTSGKWGIPDYCWEYGTKPGFNFHNSDFGIDIFTNKQYDSRYQKTFRLEYETAIMGGTVSSPGANLDYYAYDNSNNTTYKWTAEQAEYFNTNILPSYNRPSWGGRVAAAGDHKMGTDDLAFAVLENTRETAIDVKDVDAQPFVLFARWVKDGDKIYYRPNIVASGDNYSFANTKSWYGLENSPSTGLVRNKKYDDCNRTGYKDSYGSRDVPVMRSAEAYLLRAEAYGRKGQFSLAIDDINALRKRAAFKSGENRDEVLARLYPGHENLEVAEGQWPYSVVSDCYDKIKVDASYWDGSSDNSIGENYVPSANTELKRFIEFIYNEWAREFNEEEIYYTGVHHAGIQAARIQYHNQMGANPSNTTYAVGSWPAADNVSGANGQTGLPKGGFQNYMTLKPFPQSFIDMLTDESGALLDDAARKAYQNYGY